MMRLSQNLLSKIKNYVISEQLEVKWKQSLEQMMELDSQLKEIKGELESTLRLGKLKDLDKIEQRSLELKLKKYL